MMCRLLNEVALELSMPYNVKRPRMTARTHLLQWFSSDMIRHVGLLILLTCISLNAWAVPHEILAQPLIPALGYELVLGNDPAQTAAESACTDHQTKMKCDPASPEHQACQIQCAQAGASTLPNVSSFVTYVFDAGTYTSSRAMLLPSIVLPREIRPPIA